MFRLKQCFSHKDTYVVLLYYLKTQQDLLRINISTVKQASEGISPLILCYFMLSALVQHDSSFNSNQTKAPVLCGRLRNSNLNGGKKSLPDDLK